MITKFKIKSKIIPSVYRQRVIIEATLRENRFKEFHSVIPTLLKDISNKLKTVPIGNCQIIKIGHGITAFLAWKESGITLHSWPEESFFTLDIFSCKPFNSGILKSYLHEILPIKDIELTEII